jgi:hypothetical protein
MLIGINKDKEVMKWSLKTDDRKASLEEIP